MSTTLQYAVLILVGVSAVMAVASYFATRREVDVIQTRLGKVEDCPAEFVRKSDCMAMHGANAREHDNLFAKVGGVERGASSALASEIKVMRDERRSDAKDLHARLNHFGEDISALKKASDIHSAQLERMDTKLDEIRRK